jgi:hypothetical protein
MTEKQIEQLKRVLADSRLAENSQELDDLILKSAYESTRLARTQSERQKGASFFDKLLPVTFMRSATLAVVFTLGVFLVMGQLVSVDENIAAFGSLNHDVVNLSPESTTQVAAQTRIRRPENIALEAAPSHLSRDQILMSFELKDTDTLMDGFSFEFSPNSEVRQSNLAIAMVDIHSLIQNGEFDDARQRYSHLKKECSDCGLPDTLEALVRAVQVITTAQRNPLETG